MPSFVRILDTPLTYHEYSFALSQVWRIAHTANTRITFAFTERQPCLAGVSDDMATNGFELRSTIRVVVVW